MQQTLERAGGISLRAVLPEGHFFRGHDIRVSSCVGQASACRRGDLFVALVTADGDGHDEVGEAVRRGASAILAERLLPVDVPLCVVPDTRQAYGRLCHKLAGDPGESLRVVGVTGTHGKTTTSMLIASLVRASRQRGGVLTTLSRSDALETQPAARTTPAPPELAQWLSRMRDNGCTHAVVEASSAGLAEQRLAGLHFDALVLTNLRRDHVEHYGSVLTYRQAKARVFAQLKPQGCAVINADDPGSRLALAKLDRPAITFGMREEAEITAEVIERHASEQTFLLLAGNEAVPVRSRMIGDHHVYNCLAAAAAGLVMGLELTAIARGLESLDHLPGRLDRVECGQPFSVYIDCADSADRLAVCLKALRRVTRGRLVCVYGNDSQERRGERPLLGRVLEKAADVGILTSGTRARRDMLAGLHEILDGYDRPARAHLIPSRAQAIRWALQQAAPGDTLLIAGSSRGAGEETPGSRRACQDRETVRTWLYASARQAEGRPLVVYPHAT